ncbi:HAD family hydrolase [Ktedonosporobacter rubrisoli]|uniref:HAD family hydrolase n=1 Tax=Ktedonosporobacter rubrisoli TaxID=2509675 RepID=UPI0013EEB9F9|nr:HAD family hydrolase [Ktedonosporobacter rubrisoli]
MQKTVDNLKGILFDWDGTIVDSFQSMLISLRYAYRQHVGIFFPRDEEEYRRIIPQRLTETSARYAGEHAAAVTESYIQYYRDEGYKHGRVFDGMHATLQELRKRGYALGVVTNTTKPRMSADMTHHELTGLVDIIVTSEDTAERKPHPAPLLKGAERLGISAQELAYVGDYPGDVIAAKAAGMLAVGGLWGGIFPAQSVLAEQPDYALKQPVELLDLFKGRI